MRIYLASKYSRRLEMLAVAQTLTLLGHHITSRWLQGLHESTTPDDGLTLPGTVQDAGRFAAEDMDDVRAAEALVLFTEPPGSVNRGGKFVEMGLALAWSLKVYVVGPRENVFCALPEVEHYKDLPTLLAALAPQEAAP